MKFTAYTLMILLFSACTAREETVSGDEYYTCSMDPQVVEHKAGNCPICKMPLTKVKKDQSVKAGELQLSNQQIQLGNIRTELVSEHVLGDEIQLTGKLSVDKNNQWAVSSRVMGRIDKLYIKNTGEYIKSGDIIYEIYSEDLNLAAREYQLLLDKKNSVKTLTFDFDNLIRSAGNKLKLYGLSDAQIESLKTSDVSGDRFKISSSVSGVVTSVNIKEGDYIMEGGSIYFLADYGKLWAEAEVFTDDVIKIKEGMTAVLNFPGFPDKKTEGRISFVNPELSSGMQINNIRVEVDNSDYRLNAGMQVNFTILLNKKTVLALPANAILQRENGASVWIKNGANKFVNKMVKTGLEANEYIQILEGLNQGDTAVVSGAYLLDSEYLFKKGTNPMEGHDMSKM